jgi:hypothetical protein
LFYDEIVFRNVINFVGFEILTAMATKSSKKGKAIPVTGHEGP